MDIKIRELEFSDLKACSELYTDVFSGPPWNEEWSDNKALERLNHFFESRGFVGLVSEGEGIVAFVLGNSEPFLDGDWFYLREMCVSQNMQGKGIGSGLLEQLSKTLEEQSVRRLRSMKKIASCASRKWGSTTRK